MNLFFLVKMYEMFVPMC